MPNVLEISYTHFTVLRYALIGLYLGLADLQSTLVSTLGSQKNISEKKRTYFCHDQCYLQMQ